jgi:hypothetical protein
MKIELVDSPRPHWTAIKTNRYSPVSRQSASVPVLALLTRNTSKRRESTVRPWHRANSSSLSRQDLVYEETPKATYSISRTRNSLSGKGGRDGTEVLVEEQRFRNYYALSFYISILLHWLFLPDIPTSRAFPSLLRYLSPIKSTLFPFLSLFPTTQIQYSQTIQPQLCHHPILNRDMSMPGKQSRVPHIPSYNPVHG